MNAASIWLARLSAQWLIVVAASFAPCPADAQEERKPDAERAVTTANPAIPVDEFGLQLTPLAKHELADEAEGWNALLMAKAFEISAAEIAVKRKTIEIEQVEVREVRPSDSKPDRGYLTLAFEAFNQDAELVMSFGCTLILRRAPHG